MPSDSLFFQGSLPSKGIFTVVNPSADAVMLAVKDTTHSITFYNGDDAIWLKNITTLDTLDIIGEIGVDPGSGWVVGTGATNNTTLVRKFEIQKGQKDWSIGAIEWDVFPINMTDSLATHNMATCVSANVNQNSILTSVRVYPNPTNGNINISLNKTCRRILINVFDISGHKVFKSNHANKKYINFVLNQKSGLYFIEIRIGKQSSITKLILK